MWPKTAVILEPYLHQATESSAALFDRVHVPSFSSFHSQKFVFPLHKTAAKNMHRVFWQCELEKNWTRDLPLNPQHPEESENGVDRFHFWGNRLTSQELKGLAGFSSPNNNWRKLGSVKLCVCLQRQEGRRADCNHLWTPIDRAPGTPQFNAPEFLFITLMRNSYFPFNIQQRKNKSFSFWGSVLLGYCQKEKKGLFSLVSLFFAYHCSSLVFFQNFYAVFFFLFWVK